MSPSLPQPSGQRPAYIVTGPTSGIGRATAFELAKYGTLILVGRDRAKLEAVRERIVNDGGQAIAIVCDLADIGPVRRAAADIVAQNLPIAGLLNNAGIMPQRPLQTAQGWDLTFATNHLGPFALTEALLPHLHDSARVVFIASAIEDPERKPAKVMGMRGGRFISVDASVRGEWLPGGCKIPGVDAYATSKQCTLAATFGLAEENPRLHINAVEPGINPGTGLGGANAVLRFIFGQIVTRLPPFARYRSSPERAARVLTRILTGDAAQTGLYYDEAGDPMQGSARANDRAFQARVLAETREFLKRSEAGNRNLGR